MACYLYVIDAPGTLAVADIRETNHVYTATSRAAITDVIRSLRARDKAEVIHADTLEPQRIDIGDGREAIATVWWNAGRQSARIYQSMLAANDDPYPDYQVTTGPRGGIVWWHC